MKSLGRAETGGRAAAPIWLYFMQQAEKDLPVRDFPLPSGVIFAKVNPKTGLLVDSDAPNGRLECFKKDNLPPPKSLLGKKENLLEKIYVEGDF